MNNYVLNNLRGGEFLKRIKIAILALAMLLTSAAPAAFSKNDNFGVDFTFEVVQMSACATCGEYMVADTQIWSEPG
ncbi:MAG: hypothetical protein HXS44_14560, partial [Theionarchaea archaeon]|nr:hypothetical protein [Theionarchaea archaeon]